MNWYDWYMLSGMALFWTLFIAKTLGTQVRTGRAMALGARRPSEVALPVCSLFWSLALYLRSLPGRWIGMLERNLVELPWLPTVGAVLVGLGLTWFLFSLVSIGDSWRVGVDELSPGEIRATAAYSLSRNPVFLGMDAIFLGSALVYPSVPILVVVTVLVLLLHRQILEEERFLLDRGGGEYHAYAARVRRYI